MKTAFFLPSKGLARSPADFGDRARHKSKALFNGTIGAVLKEVTKVTGMTAAVASKLTLDDDYKRRRLLISHFKAKTFGQAIYFAARDIATGFLKALTGVVTNPMEGARKRGVLGFGTGLGIGVLGLVTKPVVGVLDAVAHVSQGIQTAGLQLKPRFRRTRAFDQTRAILAYEGEAAEAQEVLQRLGRLVHGRAVAAFLYPGIEDHAGDRHAAHRSRALVSNKAVFCVRGGNVGDMRVVWRMSLSEVQRVVVKNHIVVLVSRPWRQVEELEMLTMEEAVLVARKILRALSAETERSLEHVRATAMGASAMRLMQNVEQRSAEAAAPVPPERARVPEDKGKEDLVW